MENFIQWLHTNHPELTEGEVARALASMGGAVLGGAGGLAVGGIPGAIAGGVLGKQAAAKWLPQKGFLKVNNDKDKDNMKKR